MSPRLNLTYKQLKAITHEDKLVILTIWFCSTLTFSETEDGYMFGDTYDNEVSYAQQRANKVLRFTVTESERFSHTFDFCRDAVKPEYQDVMNSWIDEIEMRSI